MPSDLDRTRRNWERFGETDPMWAVLAHQGMRGRWRSDEFFANGRREVDDLVAQWHLAGVEPAPGRVLDFGCGVGRLSFPLAERFEHVVGVDISGPMIDEARRHNHVGTGCEFHLYDGDDLHLLEDRSFSAVVSLMTLQHVPPAWAKGYLSEMVRVLQPGGVLAVQIPSEQYHQALPLWRRLRRGARSVISRAVLRQPQMEMHAMPAAEVTAAIGSAGADIVSVIADGRAGEWGMSLLYVAVRRAAG